MKTKIVSAFEKNSEIWAIVRCVCHFVPLITSIVWILYYAFDPSNFIVDYILAPIMIIGWIAALVARPIEFITIGFKLIGLGCKIGFFLSPIFPFCIASVGIGFALGLTATLAIPVYVPAAITIFFFVKDLLENN